MMTLDETMDGKVRRRGCVLAFAAVSLATATNAGELPFSSDRWVFSGEEHRVETFEGREALFLRNAIARLPDADFKDGVIEADIFLPSEERGFSGIYWRLRDLANGENFYLRHHQSGNPDANQYSPLFNGSAAWQLYYGPQFATPSIYRYGTWMTLKIVTVGDEADIYIDSDEPVLRVKLKNEAVAGGLSLSSSFAPVWFSNFSLETAGGVKLSDKSPEPTPMPAPGIIEAWDVSEAFAESQLDGVVDLPSAAQRNWTRLEVEDRGFANLARVQGPTQETNTVLARVQIQSDATRAVPVRFGYSDRVRVYLDGRLLYAGDNSYQSRDYRYLGTIGLFDEVLLDLDEGQHDLVFAVSESFGGWGVMAAIANREGLAISP